MLIKITNKCSMGCSHCMENSTVAGEHMTRDVFEGALNLTKRLEATAWEVVPPLIHLSGGEATEHPDVIWFIERALEVVTRKTATAGMVTLVTNGMWLDDPELALKILNPAYTNLAIQVTNDSRFYPTAPKARVDDPRVVYVDQVTKLIPLGRMKRGREPASIGYRSGPSSFNLRSMTRHFGDVLTAIAMMRTRALLGQGGHCSPSISSDGTIVAGETNSCFPIGNIHSTAKDVTAALLRMTCNKCGLVDNLSHEHKLAIGEARIVMP